MKIFDSIVLALILIIGVPATLFLPFQIAMVYFYGATIAADITVSFLNKLF